MMIHRMIPVLALIASPAVAEVVPMDHALIEDGLWIEAPQDAAFGSGPATYDDIVAMADLDGNPEVITDEERRMIALLSQVLGATPITY